MPFKFLLSRQQCSWHPFRPPSSLGLDTICAGIGLNLFVYIQGPCGGFGRPQWCVRLPWAAMTFLAIRSCRRFLTLMTDVRKKMLGCPLACRLPLWVGSCTSLSSTPCSQVFCKLFLGCQSPKAIRDFGSASAYLGHSRGDLWTLALRCSRWHPNLDLTCIQSQMHR